MAQAPQNKIKSIVWRLGNPPDDFLAPAGRIDMQKSLSTLLSPLLVLLSLFIIGMALIQFATPDMPDNDGFYHIKFAQLIRTEGLKPDFPWLPLSILNPDEFYDHHFLFHVALIP